MALPFPVLVAGGLDSCLFVWNAVSSACIATLKLPDEQVNTLATSQLPASSISARKHSIRSEDQEVHPADSGVPSNRQEDLLQSPWGSSDSSGGPSQNQTVLVAAAGHPSITVFDIGALGERSDDVLPIATLQGHEGNVRSLAFVPDPSRNSSVQTRGDRTSCSSPGNETGTSYLGGASLICSCGDDGTCRIWDLRAPGHQMLLQNEPGVSINSVWSVPRPDLPCHIIAADANGALKAWNLRSNTTWELARPGRQLALSIVTGNGLGSEIAAVAKCGSLSTFSLAPVLSGTASLTFDSYFFPHGPNYVLSCRYSPVRHAVKSSAEAPRGSDCAAWRSREAQEELGAKRKQKQYAHAWWQQQKYAHEWWRKRGGGVWWQHLADENDGAVWGEKDREAAWADQARWGGQWWQEFRGAKPWWQQEAGGRAWWQQRGRKAWWQRPHLEHAGDGRKHIFQIGGWYVWEPCKDGHGRVEKFFRVDDGTATGQGPKGLGDGQRNDDDPDLTRDNEWVEQRKQTEGSDAKKGRESSVPREFCSCEEDADEETQTAEEERKQITGTRNESEEGCETTWVQRMATTGADGVCVLWKREGNGEWTTERELTGHDRWVWDCTFSRDGKMLVTGGSDACCKLWSVETGKQFVEYFPEKNVGAAGERVRSTKALLAISLLDAPVEKK
ncbi:WD domain, G-beta repeat-containing protein [Toxoplasma gondii GT1]|uniref:Target of rapamycin complex subunit LST8 n=5 Tax=Toxoplasma gondii TaxID=5811 RepID=S7UPG9_TOXGG|nr:WD domain, G-beta repeat-containing protein [Toxoplasma gondii GT1]KAF4643736.1 WD domain, G-beta repeat-containing protein [Toxoplasma gondii]KFG54900.1 WD domain, G-beta repeat-containing protein [Toxoplasma gondii FOU]PUA86204.1 WD domain, G-beta repeat-containing protein [Toxoplasma gondii TgCATBr9]RQX69662.1 WD domain, G-beta repeat-containing protein [Toxoplasma gondii CAST]